MNAALRVLVLFNNDCALAAGGAEDSLAVAGVEGAVRGVVEALRSKGHSVQALEVPNDARDVLEFVAGLECDVIFNQVESLAGDARREAHFAAALELRGIPYTGSNPRALALCLDKPMARALLAAHGIEIARGAVLREPNEPLPLLSYPLIVKPSREDASHGIALESVARDEQSVRARARFVIERYAQPALVEEFIAGREFNVGLIEGLEINDPPRVLCLSEIDFTGYPSGAPQIVTYGAKWIEDSAEWKGTHSVAAVVDAALERRVREAALGAWRALGLSGYARVDLRAEVGGAGRLAVIDVNSNPDLSPDAGFALTAQRSGIPYAEFIDSILEFALRRAAARA